jgi:hypothetical protein
MTSFSIMAGLLRVAAVGPRPFAGLAAWLAICVGLCELGWWGLGVWPWDRQVGRREREMLRDAIMQKS